MSSCQKLLNEGSKKAVKEKPIIQNTDEEQHISCSKFQ